MKLDKALEKAKLIRWAADDSEVSINLTDESALSCEGWQAPVYCNSKKIDLNTRAVINNRCVCIQPDAPELDCYKVLHTKIQQLTRDNGWKTVMITSPRVGEGKTTTAINLALTFSKAYDQTVLLVDCDLRRQNIHKMLGFNSRRGLIDCLMDGKPLQDIIIWPGVEKLILISGGRTIQSSTELLGSRRMKTLAHELKTRYDDRYVLFDAPPVLMGADVMALAPCVDSIVMVVEKGKTTNSDVQKAVEMLPQEKFLGFVMNRQKHSKGKDGYYYR